MLEAVAAGIVDTSAQLGGVDADGRRSQKQAGASKQGTARAASGRDRMTTSTGMRSSFSLEAPPNAAQSRLASLLRRTMV